MIFAAFIGGCLVGGIVGFVLVASIMRHQVMEISRREEIVEAQEERARKLVDDAKEVLLATKKREDSVRKIGAAVISGLREIANHLDEETVQSLGLDSAISKLERLALLKEVST